MEKLRSYTINDVEFDQFAERYTTILSSIPELKKTKSYSILYAGAADDGISAMVVLELNNKIIWAVHLPLQQEDGRYDKILMASTSVL
jgi:hypothetical protein